jgi:outer membrane protein assembly factor BamB
MKCISAAIAFFLLTACAVAATGQPSSAPADDWPQWRGPEHTGFTAAASLPEKFDRKENVLWVAKLPGAGWSTPIVAGSRVLVTCQDPAEKVWAVCLNMDGSERWKAQLGAGFSLSQGNTGASPSAIADGDRSYFLTGAGVLAAFDAKGAELWRRDIQKDHGKFNLLHGYGSSALLHGGRLYVPVIHAQESYLLGIDARTGKDVFKVVRTTPAKGEAKQAYTTPTPVTIQGLQRILLVGGDFVTAHDPASGQETWRSATYRGGTRTVPSAVMSGETMLVCGPKGGSMYLGKPGQSDWSATVKSNSPDVCTPLSHGGKFYVLDGDRKTLLCLSEKGDVLGKADLDVKQVFQASPTGADGKIYCISLGGEVVVASMADEPKVLHRADFGGKGNRASVAIAASRLYVRAGSELFCIGKGQ